MYSSFLLVLWLIEIGRRSLPNSLSRLDKAWMFISECFTGKMGLLSQTGQIYGKSHLFGIHSTNCSVEGCCAWSLPPRAQQHRGISDIHWGEERERERGWLLAMWKSSLECPLWREHFLTILHFLAGFSLLKDERHTRARLFVWSCTLLDGQVFVVNIFAPSQPTPTNTDKQH